MGYLKTGDGGGGSSEPSEPPLDPPLHGIIPNITNEGEGLNDSSAFLDPDHRQNFIQS